LVGIAFVPFGFYVSFIGGGAFRRGEGGRHQVVIVRGIVLAMLGIVLAVS